MTSDQHDPSAKRPCIRTTFFALGIGCARAAATRSELVAAATVGLKKVRRSIGISFAAWIRITFEAASPLRVGLLRRPKRLQTSGLSRAREQLHPLTTTQGVTT